MLSHLSVFSCLLFGFVCGGVLERAEESRIGTLIGSNIFHDVARTALLRTTSNRQRRNLIVTENILSVGTCSFSQYQYNSNACARLLFAPYRNASGPGDKKCRTEMPKYIACQKALFKTCVSNQTAIEIFDRAYEQTLTLKNFTQITCDDGGYPESFPVALQSYCADTINQRYKYCTKIFKELYQANRGDMNLCREYSTATTCVINEMIDKCQGEVVNATILMTKIFNTNEINPFCSESDGGADDREIEKGNFLVAPTGGPTAAAPVPTTPQADGAIVPMASTIAKWLIVLAIVYLV